MAKDKSREIEREGSTCEGEIETGEKDDGRGGSPLSLCLAMGKRNPSFALLDGGQRRRTY